MDQRSGEFNRCAHSAGPGPQGCVNRLQGCLLVCAVGARGVREVGLALPGAVISGPVNKEGAGGARGVRDGVRGIGLAVKGAVIS